MNNAPFFISIQGSYKHTEIALFRENKCYEYSLNADMKASAHLISYLDSILHTNKVTFDEIDFIAIDAGPGAFTSLRVIIATVNALAFASSKPLIGIDGLFAVAYQSWETRTSSAENIMYLPLLNAFNNDVYYALYKNTSSKIVQCLAPTYGKSDEVFAQCAADYASYHVVCSGNGASLYENTIKELFKNVTFELHSLVASAKTIGILALEKWKKNEGISHELSPLYLKEQHFKPKYTSQ